MEDNKVKVDSYLDDEKIIIEKDGQKVECEILFTFDCDDNSKTYVGYTDNSLNDKGEKNIYVSSINFIDGEKNLENIETTAEWDMINDVLKKIRKSI